MTRKTIAMNRRRRDGRWVVLLGIAWALAPAEAAPQPQPRDRVSPSSAWRRFTTSDGLPSNSVRAVRVNGQDVWIGTDKGLAQLSHGNWRQWRPEAGGRPCVLSAVDVDPTTKDVWVGTWGDGLLRMSAGRFDRFDQMNSGLAGNLVFAVAVVGGRVWAATNGGISAFDPIADAWKLYDARHAGGPTRAVAHLAFDGTSLYAAVWRGGVLRFDVDRDRWVDEPPEPEIVSRLSPASLRAGADYGWTAPSRSRLGSSTGLRVHADHAGLHLTGSGVWISSARFNDLWMKSPGETSGDQEGPILWHGGVGRDSIRLPFLPADTHVRCIATGADTVWIGTDQGLFAGTIARLAGEPPLLALYQGRKEEDRKQPDGDAATASRPPPVTALAVLGPRNRTITRPPPPLDARVKGDARSSEHAAGPTHTNADLLAARLAVAEANTRRAEIDHDAIGQDGSGHAAIDLVTDSPGYTGYGWVLPEDEFVLFMRRPEVVGMVGSIDSDDGISDLVACRTEIPVVNAARTPTNDADRGPSNPWLFRCWGDQPRRHRIMLDHVFDELGLTRVAILRTPGHATRRHLGWWKDHAARRGFAPVADCRWGPTEAEQVAAITAVKQAHPDVVLSWCDMETSAKLVRHLRKAGIGALFVGSSDIIGDAFIRLVGNGAGRVLAPVPFVPPPVPGRPCAFSETYARRTIRPATGTPPDRNAYRSFDATDHLVTAIAFAQDENASTAFDRNAVQRALLAMQYDATGERHYERRYPARDVVVVNLADGRWTAQTLHAAPPATRRPD